MRGLAASVALKQAGAGAPEWLAYAAMGALLIAFVGSVLWAGIAMVRRSDPRGDDTDDGGGSGGGGGGLRRDPPSPTPPAGSDPEWWPEFERQFAAYVERRPIRTG